MTSVIFAQIKALADEQLQLTPNIKPRQIFEKIMINETNKHLFKIKNIRDYMTNLRKKNKEKEAFFVNTVESERMG